MKLTLCIATVFLFILSFWCGMRCGKTEIVDCRELENQIVILETYNSSQAWYLADEQRKNAAYQEYIEEMEK